MAALIGRTGVAGLYYIAAANVGFVAVDTATNPTATALPAELTYIALAASLMVTWRRWQSGLVLAVMLGLIAAYAVGGSGGSFTALTYWALSLASDTIRASKSDACAPDCLVAKHSTPQAEMG